jgi:hypothetical protein
MAERRTQNFEAFLALLGPEERVNVKGTLERELARIRALPPGAARARWVHGLVEEALARFAARRPDLVQRVRCRKGCAHCCRMWVGITRDEAELLAERVRAGTARPDPVRMETQLAFTSPSDYIGRPPEEAACVFLDGDGACTVYEDRPSACRALLVASDPELCRLVPEPVQTTSILNPFLEVVASAALTVDAEGDPPPPFGRPMAATLREALARPQDPPLPA